MQRARNETILTEMCIMIPKPQNTLYGEAALHKTCIMRVFPVIPKRQNANNAPYKKNYNNLTKNV